MQAIDKQQNRGVICAAQIGKSFTLQKYLQKYNEANVSRKQTIKRGILLMCHPHRKTMVWTDSLVMIAA